LNIAASDSAVTSMTPIRHDQAPHRKLTGNPSARA
jgi:hypothetical protein